MRKRLALIAAGLDTQYMQEQITTLSQQAAAMGYDTVIFTHFVNYYNDSPYIDGEEQIYTLLQTLPTDGAILLGGTFYHTELVGRIEEILLRQGIPAVALDYESERLPCCVQPSHEGFRLLTEHFLTEHGMEPDPSMIVYGDFWLDSPRQLADAIRAGTFPKPQAVVCANDYMAFQLCLSLTEAGFSVPGEIAVGGYDGNPDLVHFSPLLTTVCHASHQSAADAVCRIHAQLTGERCTPMTVPAPAVRTGTSCGCLADPLLQARQAEKQLTQRRQSTIFMNSNYASLMSAVRSAQDCAIGILSSLYLLESVRSLQICLHDDAGFRRILSYDGQAELEPVTVTPAELFLASEQPMLYVCVPLHDQEQALGLCVRGCLPDAFAFEPYFGEYCQIISNSLERLRILERERAMQAQIERLSERDILTGLFSRSGILAQLRKRDPETPCYAVLYELPEAPDKAAQSEQDVIFAQAVNLSCSGGELAARIGASRFVCIGACSGGTRPEQLLLHSVRGNLRQLEIRSGCELSGGLRYCTAVSSPDRPPEDLLSGLEQTLEAQKHADRQHLYRSEFQRLRDHVYEEPQLDWSAEAQAQALGISISHFRHLYKSFFAVSFTADVIDARMALARQLLEQTNDSVSEVARKCGYEDTAYFMKLIKRRVSVTALTYRKQVRRK